MSKLPQGVERSAYSLPISNVDTDKRNFPGFTKEFEYTMDDLINGQDSAGTTDTDSETHSGSSTSGYTRINKDPH